MQQPKQEGWDQRFVIGFWGIVFMLLMGGLVSAVLFGKLQLNSGTLIVGGVVIFGFIIFTLRWARR